MGVAQGDDIRVRFVHGGMQDEAGAAERVPALAHTAVAIGEHPINADFFGFSCPS